MNGFTKMNSIWVLLLVLIGTACARKENARITLDMNTDWAFYRGDVAHGEDVGLDDSRWIPATIPHIMQKRNIAVGMLSTTVLAGIAGISDFRRIMRVNVSPCRSRE